MSGIQQSKTHRFSVEQYYELGELGLLDRRTELLEGIITDMEPVSPWHANIGDILLHFFVYGSRDQEPAEANCRTLQTASAAKIPRQAGFGGRVYRRDRGTSPQNCGLTRWGQFTEIRDIQKEMLQRLETQFESWLHS